MTRPRPAVPDLYGILGVARTASPEDIKTAYHAKAKETHPDMGGTAEAFTAVQRAYDVLSDPQRRDAYDHGATIEDKRVDDVTTSALRIIEQMMAQALQQITPDGSVYDNVLDRMRSALTESRASLVDAIGQSKAEITRLTRFAKRFSAKEGTQNYFAQMVEYKIVGCQQRIVQLEAGLTHHDRARE